MNTNRQGVNLWQRPAWLPIPLLAAAIIVGRAAGLQGTYQNETLRLVLSFTFYTLVSLGTLFLIGRSFLASGTPGLLLLECGVVLWSLAGTVGDLVDNGDANINVTIFNTGILLAGLCHLAGAILSLRPHRALRAKPLWLGAGCALALGGLGLITWAALARWLPVFFIPGRGGTPVRYFVLISAIAMFMLSAGLLLARRQAARAPFTSWYALALLLLAVGLFGIMIQLSLWSVVNWLARTAQWLGGFYLLLAAIAALRESDLPLLPAEEKARPERYRYGVAIAIVLAATAVRLAFLSALGTRSTFLTLYPAVMFAALYGGLWTGLLATGLAVLLAGYFWIPSNGFFLFADPADWLSLSVFILNGAMIAWICEAMYRARARAAAAETQALLATEREAAAEVLRKSEERYHALFTGMTEGFAIHDLLMDESGTPVDYRFLDVNPAFEFLTGLKRQDVVGKTHTEVLPGDDPKWLQMYGQVALTGQPVQFENYAPVLKRHYAVYAYSPAPMQFAVIFMDITERKQAEEALRRSEARWNAAIEHFGEGAIIATEAEQVVYWNPAARVMHGFTSAEEGIGPLKETPDTFQLWTPDGRRLLLLDEWPMRRIKRGETVRNMELRLRRPDQGWERIVSYSGAMVETISGERLIFLSVYDLTEQRKAEMALRASEENLKRLVADLKRSNYDLEQFAYISSHDLQEPLRQVSGFVEMLDRHYSSLFDDQAKEFFGFITEGTSRMSVLIRDLLAYSRVGRTDKGTQEVNLAGIAQETLKTLQARIEGANADVTVDELPVVHGSVTMLGQLFQNLIGNALKFRGEDPSKIRIGCRREDDQWLFCVRDNGIGFAQESSERIFEVFRRLHNRENYEGTGIGLAICKRVVELHGGRIWAESEPRKGAAFYFTLPVK